MLLDSQRRRLSPEHETLSAYQELVRLISDVLKKRDASLVRCRLGIDEVEANTLAEIGALHDISRERVRQIYDRSIRKIRIATKRRRHLSLVRLKALVRPWVRSLSVAELGHLEASVQDEFPGTDPLETTCFLAMIFADTTPKASRSHLVAYRRFHRRMAPHAKRARHRRLQNVLTGAWFPRESARYTLAAPPCPARRIARPGARPIHYLLEP